MSKYAGVFIGLLITILVASLIFPLINAQVANLTEDNAGNANYVGDSNVGLVNLIPTFYWLAVAMITIGVVLVAVRSGESGGD